MLDEENKKTFSPFLFKKQSHPDLATLQAQSTGEDSNSSDTAASDHGDMDHMDGINGSMDHPRHSFPGFLGLQGIPGLLPGPSGMHGADSFGKF